MVEKLDTVSLSVSTCTVPLKFTAPLFLFWPDPLLSENSGSTCLVDATDTLSSNRSIPASLSRIAFQSFVLSGDEFFLERALGVGASGPEVVPCFSSVDSSVVRLDRKLRNLPDAARLAEES